MAEKHGAPGADVVEVFVAVNVDQVLALAAINDQRFSGDRAKRAHRTVDAADQQLFGAGEDFAGAFGVAL